ncbi:MAG: DNA-formamidopyrimidine glycosylase family protein [Polyangiaceae bacterium]
MPEGDTLFRTAATLTRAIGGKRVTAFSSQLPEVERFAKEIVGGLIPKVEARGKYLLLHFESGAALLTHMKMSGSWHVYRPGERWQKSPRAARVVVETPDFLAVCFAAPVVEMIPKGRVDSHPALSRLGPDVLTEAFDADEARARIREHADATIAEALLMQSSLAGIGNVYKSEALFLCRVDPFVLVGSLADATLDRLISTARELMKDNLEGGPRVTTRAGIGAMRRAASGPRPFLPLRAPRYFVYDRAGDPCLVCGAKIESTRSSRREPSHASAEAARITYYCPLCQPPGAAGDTAGG